MDSIRYNASHTGLFNSNTDKPNAEIPTDNNDTNHVNINHRDYMDIKAKTIEGQEMPDNIHKFDKPKNVEFPKEKELYERMHVILKEYYGELSPASMIGTLEMIKDDVMIAVSDD